MDHQGILWLCYVKLCTWPTPLGISAIMPWGGIGVLVEAEGQRIRVEDHRTEANVGEWGGRSIEVSVLVNEV
jgi:hypothetical protein